MSASHCSWASRKMSAVTVTVSPGTALIGKRPPSTSGCMFSIIACAVERAWGMGGRLFAAGFFVGGFFADFCFAPPPAAEVVFPPAAEVDAIRPFEADGFAAEAVFFFDGDGVRAFGAAVFFLPA